VKITTDGTATALATVFGVRGITVDAAGNLYVAASLPFRMSPGQSTRTSDRSTIKKITPDGTVTTLAGSESAIGYADGAGSAALFNMPHGIAVDAAGVLYVADSQNRRIRRVSPTGETTTLAGGAECGSGDGTATTARFCSPHGIVRDAAGNLFVSDASNATIQRLGTDGQVTTLAGLAPIYGTADGTGSSARFSSPFGIAADSAGALYVTNAFATIRKITTSGVVTTLAGNASLARVATDGIGQAATFSNPRGIASDAEDNLLVVDSFAQIIRRVTPQGAVSTFAGTPNEGGFTSGPRTSAQFRYPNDVAVDAAGTVYVADTWNHMIRRITTDGRVDGWVGGSAELSGSSDGNGGLARFNYPSGITVDTAGNVYVSDRSNHTIRKITSSGDVSTLAGSAGMPGSADGQGSAARFNYPMGLKADSAGNLYVADSNNNTIRKITPEGVVTTVAGVAGQRGIVLGPLPGRLSWPYDVTLVGDKTLYVTSSNSVLQITLP
jgi:sugar lactone lactonase YvrE